MTATPNPHPGVIALDDAPIRCGEYALPFSIALPGAVAVLRELETALPSKSDAPQATWEALRLAIEIIEHIHPRLRPEPPAVTLFETMSAS